MPYYIKPTFSFSANSNKIAAASDPGPSHFSLSLNVSPTADTNGRITVDLLEHKTQVLSTDDPDNVIIDGSAKAVANGSNPDGITGNPYDPGVMGGWVYMKNNDATHSILIGILPSAVHDADGSTNLAYDATPPQPAAASADTSGLSEKTGKTFRTMTLKAGEFLWMPFDYTGDIIAEANSGTPQLEWWLFDRA